MKIEYFEQAGVIRYFYEEKIRGGGYGVTWEKTFNVSGSIPMEIREKGIKIIKKYTQSIVRKEIKRQKKEFAKQRAFEKHPNYIISSEYAGCVLRGRIISAENCTLVVQLDEPFCGEGHRHFGWSVTMAGKHIFNAQGQFTEEALHSARQVLIQIYFKEKYKQNDREIFDLVEKLN